MKNEECMFGNGLKVGVSNRVIVDGCVVMTSGSKTRLVFGTCYNVHSYFFQRIF
jgi:hypothetical protein